ncbi:MAG: dicarboxylate/amino acid:cation symporter [Gammaproteobacteria bacterium]|jgi:proton glutamate symport protein|nr:dicarboxylate/amino acid:cation symporter [Gammaproteobacteria bacterium]MBT6755349.1 dicarboxylate/amino acid:cation symporter [Gammaproteobacteria bacterium]MBT7523562.1 dicarboxylate/amino acid:cation symporter [Gammaproteobacteria bacterium]MBT7814656.1 dicarboxylate/amino acid:cation symporter [Gammaproteobacteria bacterium]
MDKTPSSKIIFFFLFLGFLAGLFINIGDSFLGINLYNILDLVGKIFLNSLKMIVVPLIMSSLIYNISSFSSADDLSNIGIKTIVFYLITSFSAVIIGITVVNFIEPGLINGSGAANIVGLSANHNISEIINSQDSYSLNSFLLSIFSGNMFYSIANGNMLFIIFFSVIFGLALRSSTSNSINTVKNFWEGAYLVFLKIMSYILFFTPYGVFCLVAKATINFSPDSYIILLSFFSTVIIGLMLHVFVFYPLVLFIFKRNILDHFKGMSSALLMAFSSSSSLATIPVTTKCLISKLGYKEEHVNFIIPFGATINMDGTALFECVAVIFIAQLYGVDLSYIDQFLILSLALITSIGVAGIPSASFVAIIVILSSVGLPLEAVGIILGIDRVLDMLRTSVNVFGDSCCVSALSSKEQN